MQQPQQIDWAGLVTALTALITAITLAITIYNSGHLVGIKQDITLIDGKLQAQMAQKVNVVNSPAQPPVEQHPVP